MISRVTAEFESPELAELAIKRVKDSAASVYSAKVISSGISERAQRLGHGKTFTFIPTYNNNNMNYLTAVMESPSSYETVPEPARNRKASACIICGKDSVDNVSAVFNAMGGLNIRSIR